MEWSGLEVKRGGFHERNPKRFQLVSPFNPAVALDLKGRYVFLKQDGTPLPPRQWNADYWSTTAGLAFKF